MAQPTLSVILSTYNKPLELRFALEALIAAERESDSQVEVLVADDGSTESTKEVIDEVKRDAPIKVEHVYQADEGFRLARIRNQSILKSTGDILIFIDGDSLAHPQALLAHAKRCRPGFASAGARCFLTEEESDAVLDGTKDPIQLGQLASNREAWRRRRRYFEGLFHRYIGWKIRPKLIGGNCAIHRRDLERINGFDQRFEGWGLEDDDLSRRLRKSGVKVLDSTLDSLVSHLFHLTHPSHRPTMHHTKNYQYFNRGEPLTACRFGLKKRELRDVKFLRKPLPSGWEGLEDHLTFVDGSREVEALMLFGNEKVSIKKGGPLLLVDLTELNSKGANCEEVLAFLEGRV